MPIRNDNLNYMLRLDHRGGLSLFAFVVFMSLAVGLRADEGPKEEHFDRAIAPLLASRCLECHAGAKPDGGLDLSRRESAMKGGDSGLALMAGKPDESLLWEKIRDGEMPPKHPLPEKEREALRRWIAEGAHWGTETIDPYRYTTDSRAGYDWWSFQPLEEIDPPSQANAEWTRNGIDQYILKELRERGLQPSAPADPRSLVRRVYFDLTGLPPSPEAIEAFVADPSESAFEKIVDQLLASKEYGERWGQHWLDIVRYGESGGFERNEPRHTSWYYRDWVIKALNSDMPYDEFVRAQLTGDLTNRGVEGAAAAGFLVAGVHNTVVGSSERMRKLARQDELEELAGTVGQTFLGLTVNCARCHAHKFDPISLHEYYQFIAALDGVNHGEREFRDPELQSRISGLQSSIRKYDLERREVLAKERSRIEKASANLPLPISSWSFDKDFQDEIGPLHGEAVGGAKLENGALVLDGKEAYVKTKPSEVLLRDKTLEVWVILDDLGQRGGGVMTVQRNGGERFDAIVYGEQEPRRWMPGSDGFSRTKSFEGPEESDAGQTPVHIAITYSRYGTKAYRNGLPYGEEVQVGIETFIPWQYHVAFGIRHLPAGGNRMFSGKILRANLYDRVLTPEEMAASVANPDRKYISEESLIKQMPQDERVRHEILRRLAEKYRKELEEAEKTEKYKVYSVIPSQPAVMQVHLRGDVTTLAEEAVPGGIAATSRDLADFKLGSNATDTERRQRLADWMTDRGNALFQRVIANRLWHYHFGVGIVETPNDFGFNGGRPSHPELLDWLAVQLKNHEMRLKPLHRLMVLSATYRQSSAINREAMKIDAGNRLLWRSSPRRLEGESLRDGMLAVAGILDLTAGGPGYQDVTITPNNGTTYYEPIVELAETFRRRSVYRFIPRGGRNTLLDTFDCPDPAVTAPRRQVTTTPLQALSLLNNQFVLTCSEKLAERVQREVGDDEEKQVFRFWKLAVGREPDEEERTLSLELMRTHGAAALGRALFNSNEFVVLE